MKVERQQHVYPLSDVREHITNGDLCPCLPRRKEIDGGAMITHNAYDGREIGEVFSTALDLLGVALADHEHHWSDEERDAYEHARSLLVMHYPKTAGV